MADMSWLIALSGAILVLIIVSDIVMTVLHVDTDGPVAWSVFQVIWRTVRFIIRIFPSARRFLISMTGPMMIITIIAVWIGLFILGFALIYWPYIDVFRAEDEMAALGFIQALYFSGVTATVLGYGDITPLGGTFQIVSFVQSGFGFALLTGILTFLLNLVAGVSELNAFALRLWAETGRSGNGTTAILRSLENEDTGDLRLKLQSLLDTMHSNYQKMHQFPILDLFYRSRYPKYSREIMIRSATQMAVTALILSYDPEYRRLKTVSEELGEVSVEIMRLIAKQHLSNKLLEQLISPEPQKKDVDELEKIKAVLTGTFPVLNLTGAEENKKITGLIFRLRVFLDEVDKLTGWRSEE